LDGVGVGNVSVEHLGSGDFTVTFDASLGDVPQLSVSNVTNTGTWNPPTTTTQGSAGFDVQTVTIANFAEGLFTMTYAGETTAPLPVGPATTAGQIEAMLEALPNIVNVTVTGDASPGGSFTITFVDPATPVSLIVVNQVP
jgi:hypothetical protein